MMRSVHPVAVALLAASTLTAAPPFAGADTFIQKNCSACHNSPKGSGRLDLTRLAWEPANPDNFAL
jgi:cytochrome c peroxidase